MNPNQLNRRQMLVAGAGLLGMAAIASVGQAQAQDTASLDHPNVEVIQRYYQAYGSGDLETIRRQIFAPSVAWTIPGHHPLAGTKRGADEVFAFFEQLAKARFRAELLFLGSNDLYVVDVHRGWSNIGQDDIDQLWTLLFRIENRRIVEAVNFPSDQHAADAFFWQHYDLKPIPDRLA